jgi:hypothetical protein
MLDGSMNIMAAFKEADVAWADGRAKQRHRFENRDAISTVEKLRTQQSNLNFIKN